MATPSPDLTAAVDDLREKIEALRSEVSGIGATRESRWQPIAAGAAGAVVLGLALGFGFAKAIGPGEGSVDTLIKDLAPRLTRIESDVHALRALHASAAPDSSALRSILEDADLSAADKDRVAQLATDSIRETINRNPNSKEARSLRELMAAVPDDEASLGRKTRAAREVLKPIFKAAAEKAELGAAAIGEVTKAVGSLTTDAVTRVGRELPGALIGAGVGLALDAMLDAMFDDTDDKLKKISRKIDEIKGACTVCKGSREGLTQLPAPPCTAAGSVCPATLADPESVKFHFASAEHTLFCENGDTRHCAERQRVNEAKIEAIAKLASDRASAKVLIWAHTDTVGRRDYNDELALKRSNAVRKALIGADVSADRIREFPLGERLLAVPDPAADATPNADNRVVIVALGYRD